MGDCWRLVVHCGVLATGTIAAWVVGTSGEAESFPVGSIILSSRLGIIEADVVDAIALPTSRILQPSKVLLGMVGDLQWCSSGDKVLRDVLSVFTAIHLQTMKELPALAQGLG
jgi:hypothetical protein